MLYDDTARAEELLRELLWQLAAHIAKLDDIVDRLVEETRRRDVDRAERAREARRALRRAG